VNREGVKFDDEDLNKLLNVYMGNMKDLFSSNKTAQTGLEVAEFIFKVMKEENPHLRYATNEMTLPLLKQKYSDVSGDNLSKVITERYLKEK
jgi:hypothetical protein